MKDVTKFRTAEIDSVASKLMSLYMHFVSSFKTPFLMTDSS